MKKIGMLLIFVLCMSFALSQDFDVTTFCNEELPDDYELPGGLPFSNEVLNFYVAEESVGHVVLKDKKVDSYGCSEHEKPTYKIYVAGQETLDDIAAAEDPIEEYRAKKKSGELKIKAVGFFKNIKWFFIDFFSRFF